MKIQAFVPDWPGPKQHADALVSIISQHCPVTVLNDSTDYFNAQWEKARQRLTADVLLWVMADVWPPKDFEGMMGRMGRMMQRGDIGWYAPDVAWTCYIYDQRELPKVEPDIYEVPNTDALCFAVRADVVRAMPFIDPAVSFMWGMDFAAIATAKLLGLKAVRDYRFKAEHPNSTGYDIPRASLEMEHLAQTYSPELKSAIQQLMVEANRLKRLP